MMKRAFVCGLATMVVSATAWAEDFPLTFRTIPAKDVMSFPGGSGIYGQASSAKPEKLRKEPKAISRHPLYGVCSSGSGPTFLFRLDESKGAGKGYDRLIVDMNQNGDLSDDPVVQRTELNTDRRVVSPTQMQFGPIEAPVDKALANGRPVYFAQVYVFNTELLDRGVENQSIISGQVMLKAGWYLDTTVTMDGLKQRVGVFDGDCNLHIGDLAKAQVYTNGQEKSWYFQGGDSFLLATNSSSSGGNGVLKGEARAYGPILYLGSKAYKAELAPDCKSLRVEPYQEALAEMTLQPRGDQVRTLTLAREQPGGRWQLIQPSLSEGKALVPPGNYRLYSCYLLGKGAPRDQVLLFGMQRVPQTPVSIVAGKANTFKCGAPLDIKVTATKTRAGNVLMLREPSGSSRDSADAVLRISANVAGAGGEIYSTFQKGEGFRNEPPKPTFTIAQGGKTIANGNLEFG
jgi:hypothetical protein